MNLKMSLLCINVLVTAGNCVSAFVSSHGRPPHRLLSSLLVKREMASAKASDNINCNISRLDTLQSLLSKVGAPGSRSCNLPEDLEAVSLQDDAATLKLHPHLYPIAKSKKKPDHYICALRRAYADDALYTSSTNAPWPIVEAKLNGPGYSLLSLNSEHLMRRIAAEADANEKGTIHNSDEIIDLYNKDLGQGLNLVEPAFDNVYDRGSVKKLGYGTSKYMLLRVGPFPDLYEEMASQHSRKGDESSALIAAEASNGKFTGFASTFKFYAELLSSFPNRQEESRDAARVCLRMPLPSIGMFTEDIVRVSQLAELCTKDDDVHTALGNMMDMYEKIKKHEQEDEQGRANMTPEQLAIDEANQILDRMVFVKDSERDWSSVREQLADIYSSAGMEDMAAFVNP